MREKSIVKVRYAAGHMQGARKLSAGFVAKQFKPGQSGNPTGSKGKSYSEVVAVARTHSEEAIQRLIQLMRSEDERIALLAAQAILDRAYGRAPDRVELPQPSDQSKESSRRELREWIFARMDQEAQGLLPPLTETGGSGNGTRNQHKGDLRDIRICDKHGAKC
jgi:hypothetical protein